MKTQFDTEKEAQEALKEAQGKCLGFCPVARHDCIRDCICYCEGSCRKDPFKDRYNIHYPYCINPLVWGTIKVES